jgi:hypothetical protein
VLTLRLCVLYGSQNKQQLLPYKTLRDWFLQPKWRVFTARYALSPYIKQTGFVFKVLMRPSTRYSIYPPPIFILAPLVSVPQEHSFWSLPILDLIIVYSGLSKNILNICASLNASFRANFKIMLRNSNINIVDFTLLIPCKIISQMKYLSNQWTTFRCP